MPGNFFENGAYRAYRFKTFHSSFIHKKYKIFLKFEYGQDFKNWTLIDSMVSQPRSIHTVSNKKQQITKT